MSADKIEIPTAIVCDDLRREENGKEILIGVYSGDIVFPQLPSTMRVCVWIPWSGKTSAENPGKFQLRISDRNTSFIQSEFEIDTQGKAGAGSLAVGGIPLRFDGPTLLNIEIKRGSGKWKTIRQIKVRTGKSDSSTHEEANQ